jgi:hypothetical protein
MANRTGIGFTHFNYLPMSQRMVYTMALLVLGLGYLFAMIQVFTVHAGRDGDPMLSANDLRIAYSGNPDGTKLESALRGPMADMLPAEKREVIFAWLHNKATQEEFDAKIGPILQEHCVACHSPEANPHLPDLRNFEGASTVAAADSGVNIPTLVRVSHIHMFSITFIFFIVSTIFTHAYVKPLWLKCVVIVLPFLTIIMDIFSWYLTKVMPGFAWMVIISGALMGVSFTIQWVVSMYQMWLYKVPEDVASCDGALPVLGVRE